MWTLELVPEQQQGGAGGGSREAIAVGHDGAIVEVGRCKFGIDHPVVSRTHCQVAQKIDQQTNQEVLWIKNVGTNPIKIKIGHSTQYATELELTRDVAYVMHVGDALDLTIPEKYPPDFAKRLTPEQMTDRNRYVVSLRPSEGETVPHAQIDTETVQPAEADTRKRQASPPVENPPDPKRHATDGGSANHPSPPAAETGRVPTPLHECDTPERTVEWMMASAPAAMAGSAAAAAIANAVCDQVIDGGVLLAIATSGSFEGNFRKLCDSVEEKMAMKMPHGFKVCLKAALRRAAESAGAKGTEIEGAQGSSRTTSMPDVAVPEDAVMQEAAEDGFATQDESLPQPASHERADSSAEGTARAGRAEGIVKQEAAEDGLATQDESLPQPASHEREGSSAEAPAAADRGKAVVPVKQEAAQDGFSAQPRPLPQTSLHNLQSSSARAPARAGGGEGAVKREAPEHESPSQTSSYDLEGSSAGATARAGRAEGIVKREAAQGTLVAQDEPLPRTSSNDLEGSSANAPARAGGAGGFVKREAAEDRLVAQDEPLPQTSAHDLQGSSAGESRSDDSDDKGPDAPADQAVAEHSANGCVPPSSGSVRSSMGIKDGGRHALCAIPCGTKEERMGGAGQDEHSSVNDDQQWDQADGSDSVPDAHVAVPGADASQTASQSAAQVLRSFRDRPGDGAASADMSQESVQGSQEGVQDDGVEPVQDAVVPLHVPAGLSRKSTCPVPDDEEQLLHKAGGIHADGQGLGKTMSTIAPIASTLKTPVKTEASLGNSSQKGGKSSYTSTTKGKSRISYSLSSSDSE